MALNIVLDVSFDSSAGKEYGRKLGKKYIKLRDFLYNSQRLLQLQKKKVQLSL
jgi:hypothetical protein